MNKESITLIPLLAKGSVLVSDSCYKADIAEGVYRACIEKIKDLREQIESYRSILSFLKTEMYNAK